MRVSRWIAWVLSLALLSFGTGSVLAQSEPTLDQIYQAANSGKVKEAQSMIEQVLKNHPNSAKAHYVKAELAARQGDGTVARRELATAERIAPGLPFVRPESLRALQSQVANLGNGPAQSSGARQMGGPAAPAAETPSLPWGKLLLGAAVVLGIAAFMRRRRQDAAGYGAAGTYANGTPMPGAGYGYGAGPGMPPGSGPYPYGAPGAAPSMGSTLGRGLATGLAVGAGAVAAQEIGRRMFDHHGNPVSPDALQGGDPGQAGNFGLSDPSSIENPDMGGQDFGIADGGSWDDAGGGLAGGDMGGDWDT